MPVDASVKELEQVVQQYHQALDVLVRGRGGELAAWLLGRLPLDATGLAVSGRRVLAVGLPGWFPLR